MNRNIKLLGIVAAILMIGGAYWIGSSVTAAQMGLQPSAPVTDPMARMTAAMERMAAAMDRMSGMGSSHMGMMGGMMSGMKGGMGMMEPMDSMMQAMEAMMQQMQDQMGQMMQPCQLMIGGMSGPMGQAQAATPATPAGPLSEKDLTRTTNEASITVAATFMNPLMKPEETAGQLIFKIALDTHSGDLMQYDLAKLAMLHTSEGVTLEKGFTWEPQNESAHHRAGLLKIDASIDGKPLINKETKSIELHLREIGVPMRLFKWEEAFLGKVKS